MDKKFQKVCPYCGAEEVIPVIYGMPVPLCEKEKAGR